jgi:hypothetical protein
MKPLKPACDAMNAGRNAVLSVAVMVTLMSSPHLCQDSSLFSLLKKRQRWNTAKRRSHALLAVLLPANPKFTKIMQSSSLPKSYDTPLMTRSAAALVVCPRLWKLSPSVSAVLATNLHAKSRTIRTSLTKMLTTSHGQFPASTSLSRLLPRA